MKYSVRTLWVTGGVAFFARLAVGLATGGVSRPELNEYDAIARNLIVGDGFTYTHLGVVYHSYAPPLYSWITAASYWLTGSIVPVMLLQAAAGACLAAASAAIAVHLFGAGIAAAAAGGLVAVHPGLVFYAATKAHPLTFDALFFTLALLQTLRVAEQPTTGRGIGLGLMVGIGMLSRATAAVFLPLAVGWLFIRTPRQAWRHIAQIAAVALVCAAAIVGPWTLRNTLLHDRFVLMVTTDSEVFWRGNNPHATGHSYIEAGRIVLDSLQPAEWADLRAQPNEVAQADWFAARAAAFIREEPEAFLRLTLRKFFYFWWFSPQTGVLYPRVWLQAYMAFYVGVVLLAAVGIGGLARAGPQMITRAVLVGGFLITLSALQSLYYVEGRHRWAVEPILLAVSGGGVAALVERRTSAARLRT